MNYGLVIKQPSCLVLMCEVKRDSFVAFFFSLENTEFWGDTVFPVTLKNCSALKGYSIWAQAGLEFDSISSFGNEKDVWFLWVGKPQTDVWSSECRYGWSRDWQTFISRQKGRAEFKGHGWPKLNQKPRELFWCLILWLCLYLKNLNAIELSQTPRCLPHALIHK